MSQLNWTLVDDFDGIYEVGLYHGDKSKHVLIYVNEKPVIVDFNINETKKYSFYVGHELCDLRIVKESDTYTYSFIPNKTIATPLNQARSLQNKKYKWYIVAIVCALIFLIMIIWAWCL